MAPSSRALAVLALLLTSAAQAMDDMPMPPGAPSHTARMSGNWNVPETWWEGTVPGDGAFVHIPRDVHVTINRQQPQRLKYVWVEGELRMAIGADTALYVETLYVAPSGAFMIGGPNNPVDSTRRAEIVFIDDGVSDDWDEKQMGHGFVSDGEVRIHGAPKTHVIELNSSVNRNLDLLEVGSPLPADWRVNDEIVLTGTFFRRFEPPQDELRRIAQLPPNQLKLDAPLAHDHMRVRTDLPLHIANLTRNVIFRSEHPSPLSQRGHVMLRGKDVEIRYVAFENLGRTDKSRPLDDFEVLPDPSSPDGCKLSTSCLAPTPDSEITNRRGRYAVHFHEIPIPTPLPASAPTVIQGSVVRGTPGWGFVNHSSYVDFLGNIAYDFKGAGFVTEAGDELGSFVDNVAIRGMGSCVPDPLDPNKLTGCDYRKVRLVFGNNCRPQQLSDFAFSGDGFWFQGPAIRARDNIANGCNGAGMIWFTTGAAKPSAPSCPYTGFPASRVASLYGAFPDFGASTARTWNGRSPTEYVIADLPILECDGFTGYGNFVGFRVRFNNDSATSWYSEKGYDTQMTPRSLATPMRMRERISNLDLWNNEQGFSIRYNTKSDWSYIKNINRLDYTQCEKGTPSDLAPCAGAEIFDNSNDDIVFKTPLVVDGYDIAAWIEASPQLNGRSWIRFDQGQQYSNYVNRDTWYKSVPCPVLTSASASQLGTTTARLSWAEDPLHHHALVRYKRHGTQRWSFANAVNGVVDLSGLSSGSTYDYQISSSCWTDRNNDGQLEETSVSNWSSLFMFATK